MRLSLLIALFLLCLPIVRAESATRLVPQSLEPLNHLLYGVNNNFAATFVHLDFDENPATTRRGDLELEVFEKAGFRAIRYIGGSSANQWDWLDGDLDAEHQPGLPPTLRGEAGNRTPLRFQAFADRVGMEVVWVPNLVSGIGGLRADGAPIQSEQDIVAHAADLFRHLHDNGVEVRFVEMGNEFFFGEFATVIPNGTDYLRNHVHPVAAVVRDLFPEARIAVVAEPSGVFDDPLLLSDALATRPVRNQSWDAMMRENILHGFADGTTNFDAVTYHNYGFGPGRMSLEGGSNEEVWRREMLSYPQISMANSRTNARSIFGEGIRAWVTEFNSLPTQMQTGEAPPNQWIRKQANTPLHALHLLAYFITAIEQADFYEVMNVHAFNGIWGLMNFDTDRFVPMVGPSAQLLFHYGLSFNRATHAGTYHIENNPPLSGDYLGSEDAGAVQAIRLCTPSGGETVVMLNRSSEAVAVEVPLPADMVRATAWTYRGDAPINPGAVTIPGMMVRMVPIPPGELPWSGDGAPMEVTVETLLAEGTSYLGQSIPPFSAVFLELEIQAQGEGADLWALH